MAKRSRSPLYKVGLGLNLVGASVLAGTLVAGLALPAVGALGFSAKSATTSFNEIPAEFTAPTLSQASTIYDANGGYGHPDHIQVHRVGLRASELAGTARVFEATLDRDHMVGLMRMAAGGEGGIDPGSPTAQMARDFLAGGEPEMGSPASVITTRVDVGPWLAQKRDASSTLVSDIMTAKLACARMHTPLEEAKAVMKNRRIRHLPVLDEDDRLVGLVSIGDLNAHEAFSHEQTIYQLQEYLYGRV